MPGRTDQITACIGVGSNLNDPVRQVETALAELAELPDTELQDASGLYRNPPMGPADQPDYVNAVVVVRTELDPRALLHALQEIERRHGRDRASGERWGPRSLDLDILTYGQLLIAEPGLTIPHPGIPERNFVLFPLLEISPQLYIPGLGLVKRLAADSDASTLEKLGTI